MDQAYFANSWIWIFVAIAYAFVILEMIWRKKFRWLGLVRFVWIGLLGFIVADWTRVNTKEWSKPEILHIFFDRSDSVIRVPARREREQNFLNEIKVWADERKQPLHIASFGDSAREEGLELPTRGSLKTFLEPAASLDLGSLGAVIVISDGLWTDYAKFSLPTYSVQIGDSDEKDVWIENLQPVFTAFLKNRLKIPVTIGQKGFRGKSVKVSLSYLDQIVDEKEVTLNGDEVATELNYFPEKMGEKVFTVSVSPLSGEISEINNRASVRVRTVRDKIRILHICGKPSDDLKAWRLFLTRQPDVDLVSFYILRSLNDDPEAKNYELSLIPFPYEELFSTELEKFDVVILQNFDFNLYFQPYYLSNLANFVRQGGSLLMIGGDQGFDRYTGSPLAPLFPFSLDNDGRFVVENSQAQVVSKHPVIRGLDLAFQVPTWTGHHLISKDPSSTDLVEFSGGIPFVSLRQVEQGRVAAINSDEGWKLQMQPMNEAAPFGRLARHLLQYLTFDSEMEVRSVTSSRWKVGQDVSLSMQNNERADWTIHPLWTDQPAKRFKNVSNITYRVSDPGLYEVENSLLAEPLVFETDEQPWRDEWKNLVSRDDKLKKLASESSGAFFPYSKREQVLNQPLSGRQIVSANIESWSHSSAFWSWVALSLTLFFLCADFYFRKRAYWDA